MYMVSYLKRVAERALQAEMTKHLGYAKHTVAGRNTGNSRNGVSRKSILKCTFLLQEHLNEKGLYRYSHHRHGN